MTAFKIDNVRPGELENQIFMILKKNDYLATKANGRARGTNVCPLTDLGSRINVFIRFVVAFMNIEEAEKPFRPQSRTRIG